MSLYGSIHTHFESIFDGCNNLKESIEEFKKLGAKKVVVTEHDTFTSFEDLVDICRKDRSLEIIPGVEGSFTDYVGDKKIENAHIILIAKDEEGYKSLCKLITKANRNYNNRPLYNWKILEENVNKGHLYCTSACINGIFGKLYTNPFWKYNSDKERYKKKLEGIDVDKITSIEKELSKKKKDKEITEKELEEYTHNHKLYLYINRYKKKLLLLEEEYKSKSKEEDKSNEYAKIAYQRLVRIFGEENYYFEVQNHGMKEEEYIYSHIIQFMRSIGKENIIASNDIHICKANPTEEDFIKRNVARFNRYGTYTALTDVDRHLYIKDNEALKEMLSKYMEEALCDKAISNIENVLSQCTTDYLYSPVKENHYPKFCENEEETFDKLIEIGKEKRFPKGFPNEKYEKRLTYEKNIIRNMGYTSYFLIVQDYLNYARLLGYLPKEMVKNAPNNLEELEKIIKEKGIKEEGIGIGVGRGSGAGSLCCYLLGITDINPITYDLLFERFLNPERISMPDIDADFRTDIREKVINYCGIKYHTNSTCKIITKTYGAIKGNLILAARYYGNKCYEETLEKTNPTERPFLDKTTYLKSWYALGNKLSKQVDVKTMDIPENIREKFTDIEKEVYKLAKSIIGIPLGYGQHAGGVIISKDDITDNIPLFYNSIKDNYSTQCNMSQAEKKGYLKMDFLGLNNLDILNDLLLLTNDGKLCNYALREDILKDKEIYEKVFKTGLTHGVFQFESDGMKEMLKAFQPESFEDLILLVAAYRPGPMQYLPEIIETKKYRDGRIKEKPTSTIKIDNAILRKILEPTYGCIIYQEQVMQIFKDLAGYSLGKADLVRRAMSKKHLDELEEERPTFINGCKEKGIKEEEAKALFNQMTKFAEYAFNKSHAACYALISFMTAYYKTKYPGVFYQVSLNHLKAIEELSPFASEMEQFGIHLCKPDCNYSKKEFWYNGTDKIYYGYEKIKGMSQIDIKEKVYKSIDEFLIENKVSKANLKKLIKGNYFHRFGNTEALLTALDENKLNSSYLLSQDIHKEDVIKTYQLEYEMLGFIFPNEKIMKRLKRTNGFLPIGTKSSRDTGVLLVNINPNEIRFKNNPKKMFVTYLMDKNYEIRKFYIPYLLNEPYGQLYLNGSPYSLSNTEEKRIKPLPLDDKIIFNPENISRYELTLLLSKIKGIVNSDNEEITGYEILYGDDDLGIGIDNKEYIELKKNKEYQNLFYCSSFH